MKRAFSARWIPWAEAFLLSKPETISVSNSSVTRETNFINLVVPMALEELAHVIRDQPTDVGTAAIPEFSDLVNFEAGRGRHKIVRRQFPAGRPAVRVPVAGNHNATKLAHLGEQNGRFL